MAFASPTSPSEYLPVIFFVTEKPPKKKTPVTTIDSFEGPPWSEGKNNDS